MAHTPTTDLDLHLGVLRCPVCGTPRDKTGWLAHNQAGPRNSQKFCCWNVSYAVRRWLEHGSLGDNYKAYRIEERHLLALL